MTGVETIPRMYHQRITGDLPNGNHGALPGDCLRTAVACLLNLHPREVPHCALWPGWWWDVLRAWARTRGGDFARVAPAGGTIRHLVAGPDGLAIGAGSSPRGPHRHVVLVDADLTLVHDPHPSGAGLVEVDEVYLWTTPYEPDGLVDLLTFPGGMETGGP